MFKNIEIVEINKKEVMNSLYILVIALLIGVFTVGALESGLREGFLMLFYSLTFGIFVWGGALLFLTLIEYLTIRKRANEKTVRILMFVESILQFIAVMCFAGNWQFEFALILCGVLLIAQLLRWFYLKQTGKMFHSAERH